jgi:hypothetical protein
VTEQSALELARLAEEFDCKDLVAVLNTFQQSPAQQQRRIVRLEATVEQLRRTIETLLRPIRILVLEPDRAKMLGWTRQTNFTPMTETNALIRQENAGFPVRHIEFQTVQAPAFLSDARFDARDLLRDFDLIFIGGSDRSLDGLKGLTRAEVDRTLGPFWEGGGSILLFHDTSGAGCKFFSDLLPLRVSPGGPCLTSATAVHPSRVLGQPFRLPNTITVGETHGYYAVERRCSVLALGALSYFSQRGRVGITEMCHQPPNTTDEWKLLVNIAYELVSPDPASWG